MDGELHPSVAQALLLQLVGRGEAGIVGTALEQPRQLLRRNLACTVPVEPIEETIDVLAVPKARQAQQQHRVRKRLAAKVARAALVDGGEDCPRVLLVALNLTSHPRLHLVEGERLVEWQPTRTIRPWRGATRRRLDAHRLGAPAREESAKMARRLVGRLLKDPDAQLALGSDRLELNPLLCRADEVPDESLAHRVRVLGLTGRFRVRRASAGEEGL
mmetsp:Transcript_467/g.1583  ORF Transcript_467/g.1583 Transcript_467/m.1583 type:complete len:217 (+) Transcript_467:448-1098(+)